MTLLLTFILTFVLGYTGTHYTLSSWGVKQPVTIAVGVILGVLASIFATLAVAPLLAV